jgi:hypothetical protein
MIVKYLKQKYGKAFCLSLPEFLQKTPPTEIHNTRTILTELVQKKFQINDETYFIGADSSPIQMII